MDSDKKTVYEKRIKKAQDKDKIYFYDYLSYKRAAGWWVGLINDDWRRPYKIERAKYYAGFLQGLPNYYFLGFPIKELLKSCYSSGYCHASAVALSLYFEDFEIVTCNLRNYVDHYYQKSNIKLDEFEHTFIIINLQGVKRVIDTTWGIITDYETYKYIFNIDKIRIISSEDIKKTKIYEYIKERKYVIGPSYDSVIREDEEYKKYKKMMDKYMKMCKNYINYGNKHLQNFVNRCLYQTSNISCLEDLMMSYYFKSIINFQIQYPSNDLFSLTDDEFDEILFSTYPSTIERNKEVLESYHKEQESNKLCSDLKNKCIKLIRNIK